MRNNNFTKQILGSFLSLLPILLVVLIFQIFVVKQPIPDAMRMLIGMVEVIVGLSLFVYGLEQSLFPIGESMAYAFARKGSLWWLLLFAFCLGFGTTVGEPALIAVANEAAMVSSKSHLIADTEAAKKHYALELRFIVSASVGFAIVVGLLRIIRGWSLYHVIMVGYCIVLLMAPFAPQEIIGIAYASGGVPISTFTVPLVTALGVGLASAIKGRNPLLDGFGLVTFTSFTPIVFVLAYGMLRWLTQDRKSVV